MVSKKAEGQARKAAAAESKKDLEKKKKEQDQDKEWSKGTKTVSNKAMQEMEKKDEQARKKAEKAALIAAEEEENKSKKPLIRGDKKAAQKSVKINSFDSQQVESFSASGIDNALDMLSVVANDKPSSAKDHLERHPERRVKASYRAFEEEQLPLLKAENPKLRLSQLSQMIQKKWQKSPLNPMNQAHIEHNTSRQEEREILAEKKAEKLSEFRDK